MTANFLSRTGLLGMIVAVLAAPAAAQTDCPDLGFQSDYLQDFFCHRLQDVVEGGEVPSRNVGVVDDEAQEFIDELLLVQDAFHADPRRTLDLIDRIRSAGGVTTQ